MEILKRGNEKTYEVTCKECNSDLLYTKADIQQEIITKGYYYDTKYNFFFKPIEKIYRLYEETYEYIECPVCGHHINFTNLFSNFSTKFIGEKKIKIN